MQRHLPGPLEQTPQRRPVLHDLTDEFLFGEDIKLSRESIEEIINSYQKMQMSFHNRQNRVKSKSPPCNIISKLAAHDNEEHDPALVYGRTGPVNMLGSTLRKKNNKLTDDERQALGFLKHKKIQEYQETIRKQFDADKNKSLLVSDQSNKARLEIMQGFSLEKLKMRELPRYLSEQRQNIMA